MDLSALRSAPMYLVAIVSHLSRVTRLAACLCKRGQVDELCGALIRRDICEFVEVPKCSNIEWSFFESTNISSNSSGLVSIIGSRPSRKLSVWTDFLLRRYCDSFEFVRGVSQCMKWRTTCCQSAYFNYNGFFRMNV
jgi:hypothetical protein